MKNLDSKDNKKVSEALDRVEKNGTIKWVEPLLEAFSSREEDALKARMRTLLSSIKLSAIRQWRQVNTSALIPYLQ